STATALAGSRPAFGAVRPTGSICRISAAGARVALHLDLSADVSQRKTLLMREEAEPGLSICRDAKVRLAEQTVLDIEGTVPDSDGRLALLHAGEFEMEDGIETLGLVWLEYEWHEGEKAADGARPETARNRLHRLVRDLAESDILGI